MHFAGNILYWFLIQLKHHIFFAQNSAPKLRILYPITHVIEKDCWAYIPLCTTKKLAHSTIFYKKPDLCQTLTYVHDVISNIYAWLLLPNWYGSQKAKNSSNTDFLIFFFQGRMALLVTLFLVLVNIFNAITNNSPKADGLNALQVSKKFTYFSSPLM